jgi:CO/xanthine dehydrogenase FAD-binding subunit
LPQLDYLSPSTAEDAVRALSAAGGSARVLSGGTDLLVQLRAGRVKPSLIVDLKRIPGAIGIRQEAGAFVIGGATCGAVIGEHRALSRAWPGVVEAANLIGSTQVQGRASLAGNLCNASPAADGVPPLLALDAEVELTSHRGQRRLPLRDFMASYRKTLLRPDEMLTAVVAPRTIEGPSAFLKLGARRYLVISIAMVAAIVETDADGSVKQARVAVGACSAVAQRLHVLERDLRGAEAGRGLGAIARADHLAVLSPVDDMRGTAEYRLDVTLTLIKRALDLCVAES